MARTQKRTKAPESAESPAESSYRARETNQAHSPEVLYSYTTSSFQSREHSRTWYAVFSLIAVILLGYAIVSKSPMMFVVFLLLVVLTVITIQKEPEIIEVQITEQGIVIPDRDSYPYTNIDFFGILYDEDMAFISLFLKEGIIQYVKVPLGSEDPEDIAAILDQFVERQDGQERLVDKLDTILQL